MAIKSIIERISEYQRFGSQLGLSRMKTLMDRLGNPEKSFQVIHVAGTNGKGSVSTYMNQILKEAGYTVGLYTSPFVDVFEERIQVNSQPISMKDLTYCGTQVLKQAQEMVSDGEAAPTEFEIITAIAFLYFKFKKVGWVVLEVGLGGIGDSTNIINGSALSIITNISIDHTSVLGHTLEAIAKEKAGIIKSGGYVVTGATGNAYQVIEQVSLEKGVPIRAIERNQVDSLKIGEHGYTFNYKSRYKYYESIELSMVGLHQIENALCAIEGIEVMESKGLLQVGLESLKKGLRKAFIPGRFEYIGKNPAIILDGAHNEAAIKALIQTIECHFPDKKIALVVGFLKDKKIQDMIHYIGEKKYDIIVTEPENSRKIDRSELVSLMEAKACSIVYTGTIQSCSQWILEHQNSYEVFVITGSLYLLGPFRKNLLYDREENGNEKSIVGLQS